MLGVVLGAWFVGPSLAAPQFGGAAPEGVDWPSSQLGRSSRAFFSGRQETDTRALSVLFVSAPEPSANAAGRHPTGMLEEPATIPSAGAVPTLLDREGEMGVFAKRHELGRQPSPEAARDPGGSVRAEGAGVAIPEANPSLRGTNSTLPSSSQAVAYGDPGSGRAPSGSFPVQNADATSASAEARENSRSDSSPHGPAACTVSLAANKPGPYLVGEQVVWTAMAAGCGDHPVYQFSIGPAGGSSQVVRDFSAEAQLSWSPMQEDNYAVRVVVKDGFEATTTMSSVVSVTVNSRVTGDTAVITPTINPLVALYSAPACTEGTVHVNFRPVGSASDVPWTSSAVKPCVPGKSVNFLIAGMLANTTYEMVHISNAGRSSAQLFTTGSLPAGLSFPPFTVRQVPDSRSDLSQSIIFHSTFFGSTPAVQVVATDLIGRVLWYYDPLQWGLSRVFSSGLVRDGSVFLLGNPVDDVFGGSYSPLLREIDLAGNPLRETNVDAVNAQLSARGQSTIANFHHDVQRLPDGKTAVLATTAKTVQVHGVSREYIGDMVIVLDENFQVVWAWNAFDHLDVNRGPIAEDTSSDPVDWLHSNAIAWSPADSNLVVSIRHQDWVIKIAYVGGAGDGHVIWRLGKDGDFAINSTDPYPWFSHQHDAHYIDNTALVLFDNGNTRCQGQTNCHSRGQVFRLDEQQRSVIPVLNVDLGNYSAALGGAQRLPNGNFLFTSGFLFDSQRQFGQSIEVLPDGTKTYVLEAPSWEYRSYRMNGLTARTVSPADTTTSVRSSGSVSGLNQPVTFMATVSSVPPATRTPTGTVLFRDSSTVLGTALLDATGRAVLTTSVLSAGTHTITASYNGDENFGSSISTALVQGTGSPNERFIAQVYLDLLNRPVDSSGLANWSSALGRGASRVSIVQAIEGSPEYYTLVVQNSYQSYLRRTGEPDGIRSWVSFLNASGLLARLRPSFVSSPEYFQTRASGSNMSFLDALYQDALNRAVDPAGRDGWGRLLDQDRNSGRARVSEAVFASPEFYQVLTQSCYTQFLRRSADSAGLVGFSSALGRGVREQDVVAVMIGSDEYFSRIANRTS